MGHITTRFFLNASGSDDLMQKIDESDKKITDTLEGHVKQLRRLREKLRTRKLKRRRRCTDEIKTEELPPLDLLPDIVPDPTPAE